MREWLAIGLRMLADKLHPPLMLITPPPPLTKKEAEEFRRRWEGVHGG